MNVFGKIWPNSLTVDAEVVLKGPGVTFTGLSGVV